MYCLNDRKEIEMKKSVVWAASAAVAVVMSASLGCFTGSAVLADDDKTTEDMVDEFVTNIDNGTFPDNNFREYVKKYCDENKDGVLTKSEVNAVENIACTESGIKNFKGIEVFPEIITLYCDKNSLTELDVSNNTKLESIYCDSNKIAKLNLGKAENLKFLSAGGNKITELKISGLKNIETVYIGQNPVTVIDCSGCENLVELKTQSCDEIKTVNAEGCAKLLEIGISDSKLEELNVKGCKSLISILCANDKLKTIDVTDCASLEFLSCTNNELTEIKLGKHDKLESLYLNDNKLTSLDITQCKFLWDIVNKEKRETFNDEYYCFTDEKGDVILFSYDNNCVLKDYVVTTKDLGADNGTVGDFVERLYTVALARASEQEGKDYWIGELEKGIRTGGDCGILFLLSDEFKARNLSNDAFVETLYVTFFGRDSEGDGKAYWVKNMESGAFTREDVIMRFMDSAEWCDICAGYSVRSGAVTGKASKPSQKSLDFAERLYTCCLGRKADKDGQEYWALQLTNSEATGTAVAAQFFMSEEFMGLGATNGTYVYRLYNTFMDRDADDAGADYWISRLEAGESRFDILVAFAQCQEFTDLCNSYAIIP